MYNPSNNVYQVRPSANPQSQNSGYQQRGYVYNNPPRPWQNSNFVNSAGHSQHATQNQGGSTGGFTYTNQEFQTNLRHDPSPLNDFGDMGAAVRKYAEIDATKAKECPYEPNSVLQKMENIPETHPYRLSHRLSVWDEYNQENIPEPFQRFEDFPGLSHQQLNGFYQSGFQAPTPIQAQTWPIALSNRDVVSIAKTGSGKTLAFLLPAFKKIDASNQRFKNDIKVLVLAPTRELATQIQEEAYKFGNPAGYYSACAYGGAPKHGQLQAIRSGVTILVATPGRLNDFLDSNQVNLSSVIYLVLDEADRMLDMGFEPQISAIIKRLPRMRQTLMFSATWPQEVQRLASTFLNRPVHIRLGGFSEGLLANESINQHLILLTSGEDKDNELIRLIRSRYEQGRQLVLIFVARKNTCDFVSNMLNRVGIPATAMHGDRDQSYRERTLAQFRSGEKPIMVATDVASRGIDVKGISAVINYDLANSSEDYVHRIGRTGRAGMAGESFAFVTHSNEDIWKVIGIAEVMEKNGQHPPQDIQQLITSHQLRQQRNSDRRAAENEQFQKVLLVAEKPSVAKMIAENLSNGRFRTRRGQSRANQIFEFIKWFGPANCKCKLMVTSVVGHIFKLNFSGRTRDVADMFQAKVEKVVEDTTKKLRIVEHLQELAQEADYLFLWLDCDREGENIGFEVISLTDQWVHYDNVYRASFSALTMQELSYAYENPIRPDRYAAMSVDARQELDLKIGVAFSRLMTNTFLEMAKSKFRLRDQKVVSYGPCQTPTLWFCVQRYKEIQNFRPSRYFDASVILNVQGNDLQFGCLNGTLTNQNELRQMESHVRSAQAGVIIDVREKHHVVPKPLGLNTVQLLKTCSKGLGISPTATMSAAEHLYTSGYISYPRTETTAYHPSFDLIAVLHDQSNHPNWGRIVTNLLQSGKVSPPSKGHDVGDHPPITPMRCATRNEITKANEWRIYDYVTRHFISSLMDDMTYVERTLVVDVGGYQFKYVWHEVIDKGFMHAMPWKFKGLHLNEPNARMFNYLNNGQTFPVKEFCHVEEYTKPPDYLQESELITLMDQHGIGTDASMAQHIKNVLERNYVVICGPSENGEKGKIIPQRKFFGKNNRGMHNQQQQERPSSRHMVPRGFGLAFLSCFEDLDKELCEPSIRAYMEQQVSMIATGETEKNEVVSNNLKLFHEKFLFFRENLQRVNRYFAPKIQHNADVGNFPVEKFGNPNVRPGSNQSFRGNRGGQRGFSQGGGGRGRGRGRGEFQNKSFHDGAYRGNFRGRRDGMGSDNSIGRKRGYPS